VDEKQAKKKKEPDASGPFEVLSKDDHRNSWLYYTIWVQNMQAILRIRKSEKGYAGQFP
jgi:hypothetical protein